MIWDKTLELLRRDGWELACAKCIDLETKKEFFLVSINRGDEKLLKLFPTLEEAAVKLSQFLVSDAA